jgi:hypothetical protein
LLCGVSTFESEFIGAVDHTAADFKGLTERLLDAAKTLPPSQIISPTDLPSAVGALIAFIEHGDDFLKASESGALHTAAQLGRQDLAAVSQQVGTQLRDELADLFAKARAAGVELTSVAPGAPSAAPAGPGALSPSDAAQAAQLGPDGLPLTSTVVVTDPAAVQATQAPPA